MSHPGISEKVLNASFWWDYKPRVSFDEFLLCLIIFLDIIFPICKFRREVFKKYKYKPYTSESDIGFVFYFVSGEVSFSALSNQGR